MGEKQEEPLFPSTFLSFKEKEFRKLWLSLYVLLGQSGGGSKHSSSTG